MKKLLNVKLFLLAVLVLGLTTINVSATTRGHNSHRGNHGGTCNPKPIVRTPIDAGLLTLLLGGGIALIGIKKRKNQQN